MHIPDGFLSMRVCLVMGAISAPSVTYAARKAQTELQESRVPLLGAMGAFVFAAQMVNFPVGVGTTGHLVGGALLAFTLGPAASIVIMTAILAVQALVFQDGGVLALGANVFNMALAGVLAGYLPYYFFGHSSRKKVAIFLGAALSVLTSGTLALTELIISGVQVPQKALYVPLGLFSVNAILEGAITVAVIRSLEAFNPCWLKKPTPRVGSVVTVLIAASVILAAGGFLVASTYPDTLERFIERLSFTQGKGNQWVAPLAGYNAHFLRDAWLQKVAAGLVGLAILYVLCVVIGKLALKRRRG